MDQLLMKPIKPSTGMLDFRGKFSILIVRWIEKNMTLHCRQKHQIYPWCSHLSLSGKGIAWKRLSSLFSDSITGLFVYGFSTSFTWKSVYMRVLSLIYARQNTINPCWLYNQILCSKYEELASNHVLELDYLYLMVQTNIIQELVRLIFQTNHAPKLA